MLLILAAHLKFLVIVFPMMAARIECPLRTLPSQHKNLGLITSFPWHWKLLCFPGCQPILFNGITHSFHSAQMFDTQLMWVIVHRLRNALTTIQYSLRITLDTYTLVFKSVYMLWDHVKSLLIYYGEPCLALIMCQTTDWAQLEPQRLREQAEFLSSGREAGLVRDASRKRSLSLTGKNKLFQS